MQLMRRLQFGEEGRHGKSSHSVNTVEGVLYCTETEFLNGILVEVSGA
jgi:hypothetical protein